MESADAVVGLFDKQFHQIAMYTNNIKRSVLAYMGMGFERWTYDTAVLKGTEWGRPSHKSAAMAFCYDVGPWELEFVSYNNGGQRNVRDLRPGSTPYISHMSVHVPSVEEGCETLHDALRIEPYHRFTTSEHSNPAIVGIKRFKEAIFDFRGELGYDIKLIERIPW